MHPAKAPRDRGYWLGIPHDVKFYADAGHSFANPYPAAPLLRVVGFGYDQASTDDAWGRVFTFFDEHLQ